MIIRYASKSSLEYGIFRDYISTLIVSRSDLRQVGLICQLIGSRNGKLIIGYMDNFLQINYFATSTIISSVANSRICLTYYVGK